MKKIFVLLITSTVLTTLNFALLSCTLAEQSNSGFGIYLAENNELIISNEHIKVYHQKTHQIELNEKGIEKWKSYVVYDKSFGHPIPKMTGLYGKNFILKIKGKEMYRGKFWSYASSSSYGGVVILDTLGMYENKLIIEWGYPGSFDGQGKDPRDNQEIINYFMKHGLLQR